MKKLVFLVIIANVLFSGCAYYNGFKYRQNVANAAAKKMGYDEISPDAYFPERETIRRKSSIKRILSLPVYGDTIAGTVYYRIFIFNESYNRPVTWTLYDKDFVVMGSGRLESVREKNLRLYSKSGLNREERGIIASERYTVDSLSVPFGKYTMEWNWRGDKYYLTKKIPSPMETVYGKKCHGHFYIK